MKTFISAATAFYILSPGEIFDKSKINYDVNRMYIIYYKENGWKYRHKSFTGWDEPLQENFDTENEALNAAYNHFLSNKF